MLVVTSIYAGLLALLFIVLSFRVIGRRRAGRVSLGDGGDKDLMRAMRVHGNFAEYTPIGLILIGTLELNGAPLWLIHILGASLLLGRLAHAYGTSMAKGGFRGRVGGMLVTFLVIGVAALANLALSIHLLWVGAGS